MYSLKYRPRMNHAKDIYIHIYIYTRPNLSLSSDSEAECRNEELPKSVKQTGQVEEIAKLNAEVRHCIRRLQEHGRRHQIRQQICQETLSRSQSRTFVGFLLENCRILPAGITILSNFESGITILSYVTGRECNFVNC